MVVAVAAVGFSGSGSAVECGGDAVERVTVDCDGDVVRRCCDAVNRHFVVCARFTDIQRDCDQRRHACSGQPSWNSTCLQVQLTPIYAALCFPSPSAANNAVQPVN